LLWKSSKRSWATLYQNYLHFMCLACAVPTSALRYWRKQWKTPVKRADVPDKTQNRHFLEKKVWDYLLCHPADCSLTCLNSTATLPPHFVPISHTAWYNNPEDFVHINTHWHDSIKSCVPISHTAWYNNPEDFIHINNQWHDSIKSCIVQKLLKRD
jgi:hypothetical protein